MDNCGGKLMVRKGKYGEFNGYSNYPKGKFSKKYKRLLR
jgi:ssDNA-binding Zn-finger/Zn-ribbon topoisomerase 1